MIRRSAPATTDADATVDEIRARMREADHLVAIWTDPAFRARINPEVPEYVGPPRPGIGRGVRGRIA